MKGLYLIRQEDLAQQPAHPQAEALRLLAKAGRLEIMRQHILRGASVWLTPAPTGEDLEFFYICAGSVTFNGGDWQRTLRAGDSFHAHGLTDQVVLDILEDTDLLYVSTMPIFDETANYQSELMGLLRQIDAKDHYTLQHSVNVRNYAIQLWKALPHRQTGTFGDLVLASLFHDVGKVNIPDSILKKPGKCTPEEFAVMKRHAVYTGELLGEHFPSKAVTYALQHHERLNGSGYPSGVTAEAIPFESRVIALADAFDAMTTSRVYNVVRPMEDAAQELASLPELFDNEVALLLLDLVRTGQLVPTQPVELG